MLDFLDKRKKRKLYQQWVNTSGLPQEEMPEKLRESESYAKETGLIDEEMQNTHYVNSAYLSVRLRYIIYIALILLLLIITTSVLATVLVMQSC